MSSSSSSSRIVSQVSRQVRRRGRTESIPSMKEFVHKRTVLHLYRDLLKCVQRMGDDGDESYRREAWKEVREQFQRHSYETDPVTIQMALREGERRLSQLRSLVGYTKPSADGTDDEDSWLNIKDPDDVRGRVGTDWPWERD